MTCVDEIGVDKLGVDEMGSRRSGMTLTGKANVCLSCTRILDKWTVINWK